MAGLGVSGADGVSGIGGVPGALDGYSMELCAGTHVRDTGEIGLFSGTREITLLDPQLAARLARAIG